MDAKDFTHISLTSIIINLYRTFIFSASIGRLSEMFHSGRRQCGFKADAADPYVTARTCHRPHGEKHHDAEGHQRAFGKQPSVGKVVTSHQGQRGLRVHTRRPC